MVGSKQSSVLENNKANKLLPYVPSVQNNFKMINTDPFNVRFRYYKVNHYTHDNISNIRATNEVWTKVWNGVQYEISKIKILSVKASTQRWIFEND